MDALDLGLDATAWFIARQPAIIRFLEHRFGPDSHAFGVAVMRSAVMDAMLRKFYQNVPRVFHGALERAEHYILEESADEDLMDRHPSMVEMCSAVADEPFEEASRVAFALLTILYALDEAVSRRAARIAT